jgi:hypothetical protein
MRSPAYGATNILLGSVQQRSSNSTEWSVPSTDPLGRPLLRTVPNLRVAPMTRRHASINPGLLHRGAVQGSVKLARFDIQIFEQRRKSKG